MTKPQIVPSRITVRTWDLIFLWGSLCIVVALAWGYLLLLAAEMSDMSMSGRDMVGMHAWSATEFLLMVLMWIVMMIGMMVPTAVRAISIYARIAHSAIDSGLVAATYWFVSGYVLIWSLFSVAAAVLQMGLANVGLLSPAMVSSSAYLGSLLLIAAGVYQLTPWKDVCLEHCQSPAVYLAGKFGPKASDGIVLGIRHGTYCLGCCWLVMTLLFVGGVMNLLWIAAITGFVLLEKLLPAKLRIARVAAVAMIGAGALFLVNG